ncbi:MAG: hypothetical protein ABW123_11595 [Cystobacter sp.]
MATIRSGSGTDSLDITPNKAAKATLYNSAGAVIDVANPLPVLASGVVNASLEGDTADLDSGAGTDAHDVVAIGLPGPGGHVVGGTAAAPLRVDPTGTTVQPVTVGNFPATQPVSGSVAVSNLPATQAVSGTVGVSGSVAVTGSVAVNNLPATQQVAGSVAVSNLPSTQNVAGTVAVSNLPATQPVSGSVAVSNLPATQAVSGPLTNAELRATKLDTRVLDSGGGDANQSYDGGYVLPVEIVPTTVTAGTVYWQMRNAGAKRVFVRKVELMIGFQGTAAASRSSFGLARATGANTPGGTALTPVKKASAMAASSVTSAFAVAGLVTTGLAIEQDFHRSAIPNQLNASFPFDLDFTPDEWNLLVLAPGESLLIRANGALIAGVFLFGQVTWCERT